jgi:hypothetical protein
VSRSVLLAGHDYFVVYDAVVEPELAHRFSWFVGRGDEMPAIQFVRGASPKSQDTHRTVVETVETTGFWMDGMGDSMAVISHRKDLAAVATPFGCRVRSREVDDLVFDNPDPVHFTDGALAFSGKTGLIRRSSGANAFALFHGTRIAVPGFSISTTDTELGIGGTIAPGRPPQGDYYAPQPSAIRVAAGALPEKTAFYVDGAAQTAQQESGDWVVALPAGQHHWELSDRLPVPVSPAILRSENRAGSARVLVAPVASATQYRFEISHDNGSTWAHAVTSAEPSAEITGLTAGEKLHVRAVALNAEHKSAPGAEYPIYATNDAPLPPDGLHVDLSNGAATVSWGQVLGVTEYRLYVRNAGGQEFRLLYKGLDRSYQDKHPAVRVSLLKPEPSAPEPAGLIEYCVAAVNGNGESARSRIADTNPASWRNWDPMPGEPFRRSFDDYAPSTSIRVPAKWPRYYPK